MTKVTLHYNLARPLTEEDFNQVAIQRGPVVYCLESPDLPAGVKISDVRIPADINLLPRYDHRLLGGVVVLDGKAHLIRRRDQFDDLLRNQLEVI